MPELVPPSTIAALETGKTVIEHILKVKQCTDIHCDAHCASKWPVLSKEEYESFWAASVCKNINIRTPGLSALNDSRCVMKTAHLVAVAVLRFARNLCPDVSMDDFLISYSKFQTSELFSIQFSFVLMFPFCVSR
jgi:hypothetical protein